MTSSHPSPDPVYVLRGSNSPVTCLHFPVCLPGNLYSGNQAGTVSLWDLETRRVKDTLQANTSSPILSISCLHKHKLVTHGRDGSAVLWKSAGSSWHPENHFKCSSLSFCASVIFKTNNTNSEMLAVPSDITSQVDIIDLEKCKRIISLSPVSTPTKYGMCMVIKPVLSHNCNQILIGYESGHVALWDTQISKMIDCLEVYKESVMCLDFSSKMNKGLAGSVDNTLKSFQISEDNKLNLSTEFSATNPGFSKIMFRPDSKIVAAASWDCKVRIFGVKKMLKPLAVLSYHTQNVQSLDFSDTNLLACGSQDQLISIWDVYR